MNVEKVDIKISMCDLSVLEEDESYYTNHILSHNTTTSAIFLLHYALFNTDKNLTEIADECGFLSLAYFNRVFKKVKGYTPSEFRRLGISNEVM